MRCCVATDSSGRSLHVFCRRRTGSSVSNAHRGRERDERRFTIRPYGADLGAVRTALGWTFARWSALPVRRFVCGCEADDASSSSKGSIFLERRLLRSSAVIASWRGKGVGDGLTRDRIDLARRRG